MTLDEQYQSTIDDQRTHLMKLQNEFNRACDDAKKKAQDRLKEIPETDKEAREAVLKEQKVELEAALYTLKTEVDHSTRATMKRLEEIIREKEKAVLTDLEKQLANL